MITDPWLNRWLPLLRERAGTAAVLEIGCGHGDDTAIMASAGLSVFAFDLSRTAVSVTSARVPSATVQCRDLVNHSLSMFVRWAPLWRAYHYTTSLGTKLKPLFSGFVPHYDPGASCSAVLTPQRIIISALVVMRSSNQTYFLWRAILSASSIKPLLNYCSTKVGTRSK